MWCCLAALALATPVLQAPAQNQAAGGSPQAAPAGTPSSAQKKTPESAKAPRKRVVPDLSGFEMADSNKKPAGRTALGATRGGPPRFTLWAPRLGKLYGADALFAWGYEGKTRSFNLVIRDEDDNEILRQPVTAGDYRMQEPPPALQPGKIYSWSVETSPPMIDAGESDAVEFVLVSATERQRIEQALAAAGKADDYSAQWARARILVDHRLWYDAVGAYTDLITRFPNRAELYEERGNIYTQLPVTRDLADQDFECADRLRQAAGQQ
jgi:hypothetical protein